MRGRGADHAHQIDGNCWSLTDMDAADTLQPLMTPAEVAGVLRVPTDTLAAWRVRKPEALPFVKLGSAVRYRQSDVAALIGGGAVGTAAEAGQGREG
jgi:hypothetical protein